MSDQSHQDQSMREWNSNHYESSSYSRKSQQQHDSRGVELRRDFDLNDISHTNLSNLSVDESSLGRIRNHNEGNISNNISSVVGNVLEEGIEEGGKKVDEVRLPLEYDTERRRSRTNIVMPSSFINEVKLDLVYIFNNEHLLTHFLQEVALRQSDSGQLKGLSGEMLDEIRNYNELRVSDAVRRRGEKEGMKSVQGVQGVQGMQNEQQNEIILETTQEQRNPRSSEQQSDENANLSKAFILQSCEKLSDFSSKIEAKKQQLLIKLNGISLKKLKTESIVEVNQEFIHKLNTGLLLRLEQRQETDRKDWEGYPGERSIGEALSKKIAGICQKVDSLLVWGQAGEWDEGEILGDEQQKRGEGKEYQGKEGKGEGSYHNDLSKEEQPHKMKLEYLYQGIDTYRGILKELLEEVEADSRETQRRLQEEEKQKGGRLIARFHSEHQDLIDAPEQSERNGSNSTSQYSNGRLQQLVDEHTQSEKKHLLKEKEMTVLRRELAMKYELRRAKEAELKDNNRISHHRIELLNNKKKLWNQRDNSMIHQSRGGFFYGNSGSRGARHNAQRLNNPQSKDREEVEAMEEVGHERLEYGAHSYGVNRSQSQGGSFLEEVDRQQKHGNEKEMEYANRNQIRVVKDRPYEKAINFVVILWIVGLIIFTL